MKIALIQTEIHWENIKKNLAHFSKKIKKAANADIIILPEMFSTGFSLNVKEMAETMNGSTVNWLQQMSKQYDALIMGSIMINVDGNYYNRSISALPNGSLYCYDKKHLFSYGQENDSFSSGIKSIIIPYKGWKIKPLICYDLRFPVWARNTDSYDLLIYVASWPKKRIFAWDQLLIARAIENQCYVVGVNRLGTDGNKLKYNGHSAIVNFDGTVLNSSTKETIIFETLNHENLYNFRNEFPFLNDMDQFSFQ